MPSKLTRIARGVPMARLIAAAQIVMLARQHWLRLEPHERRRVITLVRQGRGRRRNLTPSQRDELGRLIAKANPRLFAGLAVQRLSPVRVPSWIVRDKGA
jgi:hypothetical protein